MNTSPIEFNRPYVTGQETTYIAQTLDSRKLAGDGFFTKKCCNFFEKKYGFKKAFLTTSCTDALEMAAILLDIKDGDEVIAPSYTFVSTVNAFVLRGAKIIFIDSSPENPNMDVDLLESLITAKTKVVIPVHYAGISCDMDRIMTLAKKYNLFVVEDAAQAIDSYYRDRPLGSIGHLAAFSFHETKNITSGEGGMLIVNDDRFVKRAEIIREKGTNRSAFFRGEVDKYGWVDIGSSFLPSEVIAAFLWAQLESLTKIQNTRKQLWEAYHKRLITLQNEHKLKLPHLPDFASNNGHMFYIICNSLSDRTRLIEFLKQNNIRTVFHYISLHESPFYKKKYTGNALPFSNKYTDCLLRLPFYFELSMEQVEIVCTKIKEFYESSK